MNQYKWYRKLKGGRWVLVPTGKINSTYALVTMEVKWIQSNEPVEYLDIEIYGT